MFVLDYTDIF
jgi:hypothetical protein